MTELNLCENLKPVNFSLTAYRAILILKSLIEKPCTNAELIDVLKSNSITNRATSEDTLRITLNSLREAGCDISRPCPANSYKYVLHSHPFCVKFKTSQIKLLNTIRKYFLSQEKWREVIEINNLFDKIIALTGDENLKDILNYRKPFGRVRPEVLNILISEDFKNKEVLMTYATSSKKIEVINILSNSVFCENGKLYILGWYFKRKKFVYFNAEKITKIHSVKKAVSSDNQTFYTAVYRVFGSEMATFKCRPDEKILSKTDKYITIQCTVINEFKFFQQVLSLGSNFEIVEPKILKNRLAEKIERIKERYKE